MANRPEASPSLADLAREKANAGQFLALLPKSYQGRQQGTTPTDVWGANWVYWVTYPDADPKIAPGDTAAGDAWKRGRAEILRLSTDATPVSATWNPKLPTWPLPSKPRTWGAGSAFQAKRPWNGPQTRYHAGVDLAAPAGMPILAPEDGIIVAAETGWEMQGSKGVKALVMRTDSGFTILFGGVKPGSALVKNGQRVKAGEQLAVVGTYPGGSAMLHFQMYQGELTEAQVNTRKSWPMTGAKPANLVNPSDFLKAAANNPKYGVGAGFVATTAPDEGALVENDVEGGEVAEGAGGASTEGSSMLPWVLAGGALVIGVVVVVALASPPPPSGRKPAIEPRRRRAA